VKLYAIAEHRQAYASWCARNGVKQNHAVYVRFPERLDGETLNPDQFIFVPGWEKNPKASKLQAAYEASTGAE